MKLIFFYNRKLMKSFKGNKVTLKTEDAIVGLISQLFKMRAKLYRLIDGPLSECVNPKEILAIVKGLPKSLQRSKNRLNQFLLCQQLSKLVDYFISWKQKPKTFRKINLQQESSRHKPYQLFLYFKRFSEVLINRIRTSFNGNLQEIVNNKENYQLFYFINELQNLNNSIENWAIRQDKNTTKCHQSVEFVYPDNATFRKTLATTTDASKALSKHEKHSTFDEFNQINSQKPCLLRALTAKMKKRDVKLTTRCPSAASILKNQTYKQPLFESKKPILKYKHRSTDLQNKSCRNNMDSPDNFNFQSNKNSRFRQAKNITIKERKISILNKSIAKDQDQLLKVKSSTKLLNQNDRLKKTGIMFHGKRKKERIANILSSQEISSSKNHDNNCDVESQCQILDPEAIVDNKPAVSDSQKLAAESCQNIESPGSQQKTSQQSSFWENQQSTVYIRQRQIYKKARRSGKVMIKDKDQLKDIYMINIARPKDQVTLTRRRKAMLSTHNEDFTEIQKILNLQNQQKIQKQLQYDENVLLALSDALRSKKNIKHPKEVDKQPKQKPTFNSLFNEMNAFLKNYHIGKPNQEPQSVFFEQQKRIRCYQDYNFREKMKQLVRTNGISNVFEIATAQIYRKDEIYNQIHRYLTFSADSDWIKNVFSPKQGLIQKQI